MTPTEQKATARKFVERWKTAEGNEQRESNSFWIELCSQVLGIPNPTQRLDFERKVKGRRIDVFYEDMGILVENKSRGVNLDEPEQRGKDRRGNPRFVTPFEQAKWYADNITPRSVMPKYVVTCNFDEIRIHDLDKEDAEDSYETLLLEELPEQLHRLSFFTRKENSRLEREKALSVAAGEVVGKLYDAFAASYLDIENDKREQRSLNVLITRIVFLLYAEDAGLLKEHQAFYKYLKPLPLNRMRQGLIDLFDVLRTPDGTGGTDNERDPYLEPELLAFPYVNGGLFKDDIIVPQFNEDTRFFLLQEASAEFDWKDISPTIFGAVFESTLNPETRRSGGMHYTSIENIHKLTGPLFYDALKDELTTIEGAKSENERKFKLRTFRDKIASLKFLDSAAGSGNFLTETYLSLRKLENRVLEDLYGGQMVMGEFEPIQVSIGQFYGIEINDFAVEVAKTALWIAELQMLEQTREILSTWIDPLPLKSNDNIVCANALQTDWDDVLPASECSYIIGNPPFLGYSNQSEEQKRNMKSIWLGADGKPISMAGELDYVSAWYYKAAAYIGDTNCRCAFVSTNSICQGEQVAPIWETLISLFGIHIDFAWRTFVWDNEAANKAHVHCVIVGFSKADGIGKRIFDGETVREVENINPYLNDAVTVFVKNQTNPISPNCPSKPVNGSKPADGGGLVLSDADKEAMIALDPNAAQFIHPYIGSEEFLNDKRRWCLWLVDADPADYASIAPIAERIQSVRDFRLASKKEATRKSASTPELFQQIRQPDSEYVIIPQVSSERRLYVPMGFLSSDVIVSNLALAVPGATLYTFGVLQSQFHNAWMRTVAGRLKSDYRYSARGVYNNFVWPQPTEEQKRQIEECTQAIIDTRELYPDASLATLYDPDKMPADLKAAHAALDAASEAAYGVNFDGDEEKIVAHLFRLYAEATGE